MVVENHRIPIKTSNPHAAFEQLEGNTIRFDKQHEGGPEDKQALLDDVGAAYVKAEKYLKNSSNPLAQDASRHHEQMDPSGSTQSHELFERLQAWEKRLVEQDASHQVRVWNWQQEVANAQQRLARRKSVLDDQEENLRKLQFELFELQNELIESQLATREIVNGLAIPGKQETYLDSLKDELHERFDHVMSTWGEFASQMNAIATKLSSQIVEDSPENSAL